MLRVDRSMNAELVVGAVEGAIRFVRPAAAAPEMGAVNARNAGLASEHYGTFGLDYAAVELIQAGLFDTALRNAR